eukprot:scaffold506854_cov45-Prasinocladus_malaysianus.AAC.1
MAAAGAGATLRLWAILTLLAVGQGMLQIPLLSWNRVMSSKRCPAVMGPTIACVFSAWRPLRSIFAPSKNAAFA